MHFGFSYIGLIFLLMLFIPNFFWTKNKPKDYDEYAKCENKVLLILERIGEVAVSCLILIFSDFNPQGLSIWLLWLFASFGCMILYELYWIRYFRSEKTMKDFYSSYLGIPVAGATLPVLSAFGRSGVCGSAAGTGLDQLPLLFTAHVSADGISDFSDPAGIPAGIPAV